MQVGTHRLIVCALTAALMGFTTFALANSVAQAEPLGQTALGGHVIAADDPPADDGSSVGGDDAPADDTDETEEPSTDDPTEAPTSSPSPAASTAPENSDQNTSNNSSDDRSDNDSSSNEGTNRDSVGGPATPIGSVTPEPTETPQPRTILLSEHGPSPLGWVLLAAGLICSVGAAVFYLRKRPFDHPDAVTDLRPEEPGALLAADSFAEDTAELDAVPANVEDSTSPDTEEMLIAPLGVDHPAAPVAVESEPTDR